MIILGALVLELFLMGIQPAPEQPAGLGVLRAPSHLLRSSTVLPSLEASAGARSGGPVPQPAHIAPGRRMPHKLTVRESSSEPEGRRVRSARQHLPADLGGCCATVASAVARGGRSVPLAKLIWAPQRPVLPVLAFPEPGVDDTAAYQGYQTRFYRDSKDNTVQIYIQPQSARVVQLWADAANESVGFTVRDAAGRPARLAWGADAADVSDSGTSRTIEYRLVTDAPRIELGWFLLGSMRVERDFQYAKRQMRPFSDPAFRVAEESLVVADVARLPAEERRRHLAFLNAKSLDELRSRLQPRLSSSRSDTVWTVRVERPSLDARNRLVLELLVDPRRTKVDVSERTVSIRTRPGASINLAVRITTDATPLSPLSREQIFNQPFLAFLASAAAERDSAGIAHYRRLERQVRGVELLSTQEKLMAGLPNFATYFGRDMMMTALMMRPIWLAAMAEHVIASVLRKLGPKGDVSHEEALGGQAIRENGVVYDSLITRYFLATRGGSRQRAQSFLNQAREVLRDLQKTRENYHMIDDEFQLPVLAVQYLTDQAVPAERKRSFLLEKSEGGTSRLRLLLREMALVVSMTRPYLRDQRATNLVSFPKRDATHWRSASWRDSDAGYAGGRFAMDINVIWAPQALEAIAGILVVLPTLGIEPRVLDASSAEFSRTPLGGYIRDVRSLLGAVDTWRGARRHFEITLAPDEIRQRTQAKLAWLSEAERDYWQKILTSQGEVRDSLTFLVLSLDADGRPIPVVNTDPATELFLQNNANGLDAGRTKAAVLLRDVAPFMRPFPVGLFVEGLGPLVANDAYPSREIWERFRADPYHGPRVVWGREVNLFFIGLANQILGARDSTGQLHDQALEPAIRMIEEALRRTLDAVNASGLQHNELWSYEIKDGRLKPTRYGTSSDVQLWNTTTLVVQFVLSKLPQLSP